MKKSILITILIGISFLGFTQSSGPFFPVSVIDNPSNGGTMSWSSPSSAALSDNIYSTNSGGGGGYSYFLFSQDLGFTIPLGDVIDGVQVDVECYTTSGSGHVDYEAYLIIGGVASGLNKATLSSLPSTESIVTYGGPTDLWGLSLTETDINDVNFGFAYSVQKSGGGPTAYVDAISITVYHHTPVTCSPYGSNVTCFGQNDGAAFSSSSGGLSPLMYNWSNGATTKDIFSISAGTYTVTVTDFDAHQDIQSVTITEPSAVGVSTWINNNVSCFAGSDGSIGSSGFGGTGGIYTYQWGINTGYQTISTATGVIAGNHTITVTDINGCTGFSSISVSEPSQLSITSSGIDESCFGACDGQLSTIVTGGSPGYSYMWSASAGSQTTPTVTGICEGTHNVTVTDLNGCQISDVVIANPPNAITGGVYTIGGAAPNYASIQDAINDLYCKGVSGAVTFNIRDGIYNEQLNFTGTITGANLSNTVTFQSESGNASLVSIEYTGNLISNYTVLLDGVSFLNFNNLTFKALDNTYGHVIQLQGGSTDNVFRYNDFVGINTTSTSVDLAVIYSGTDMDNNNTFEYNAIIYGSIGIQLQGVNSSNLETGIIIGGNDFNNQYSYGMYFRFLDAVDVHHNNLISNTSYNSFKGMYMSNVDGASYISSNEFYTPDADGIMLDLSTCNSTVSQEILISNNMVSIGVTGASVGISIQDCNYIDIHHNTVNISSSNIGSFCFQAIGSSGGNVNVINNIFSNPGLGQCVRVDSPSPINTMDYNNLFKLGVNLGTWFGSSYATLTGWRTASGQEANSVSVDPVFTSSNNLSLNCNSPLSVTQGGFDLSSYVTDDYEYELRGAPVSIGADEYNGTGLPLNGIYTVGGLSPSYPDLTSALTDLMCNGVSGPVTINIRSGTYYEQLDIGAISGTSASSEVIFTSENGDSTSVVISNAGTVTKNYTIALNGTDYVKIIGVTIEATDANYGHAIEISGYSNNCIISNNIIKGVATNSVGDDMATIYSPSTGDENFNSIINNNIYDGSFGVKMLGTAGLEQGNVVDDNNVEDFYVGGIVLDNQLKPSISANYIYTASSNAGTVQMIALSSCNDNLTITDNEIFSDAVDVEGIAMISCYGVSASEGYIFNNMIRLTGKGILLDGTTYQKIYHNSIEALGSTSNGIETINGAANIELQNNISYASGGGYGLFADVSAGGGIVFTDLNDFASSGLFAAHWEGTDCADVIELNAASGQDANSITVDPIFLSPNDLHLSINSSLALKMGANLTTIVPFDFDGNIRDVVPWLGCDERLIYYWVGNAGQWSDAGKIHWAKSSGGTIFYTTPPTSSDFIIFDTNSFSGPNQLLQIDITGYGKQVDFQDISRTPIFYGSGALIIGQ